MIKNFTFDLIEKYLKTNLWKLKVPKLKEPFYFLGKTKVVIPKDYNTSKEKFLDAVNKISKAEGTIPSHVLIKIFSEYEMYLDESYYDMWTVRRKDNKSFYSEDSVSFATFKEAEDYFYSLLEESFIAEIKKLENEIKT